MANTQVDHEKVIIDAMCDDIRQGINVPNFVALLRRLTEIESAHAHQSTGGATKVTSTDHPDPLVNLFRKSYDRKMTVGEGGNDLDLNTLGYQGFNCLHAAAGSGNIEMAEYLLAKRYVYCFWLI